MCFIQTYKTPSESKTKEENRVEGGNSPGLLEALAGQVKHLVKAMFARATSSRAGSEARGEGRERGYFD